jgi:4-amino-4-deoxy-L-arabinose transferase-like glycosyltransferase
MMNRSARAAGVMVMLLAAAVTSAQWSGHVDDVDANLYRVVTRHMLEDHTWTQLRYLQSIHPEFREHLPFGFWPMAVVARWAGEGALPMFAGACTLAAIALAGWIGRRLFGTAGALVAMLILATTESFTIIGGRERLDPLLVLLATAAAAPILVGKGAWRNALWAGLIASLAALVKGPFGLVPLCAAWGAYIVVDRPRFFRAILQAAVSGAIALVPFAAFLVWDHLAGGGSWWRGYGEHQLLASAVGNRFDGTMVWWFPFRILAGRFWPGLPLVILGAAMSARRGQERNLRLVAVCALLAVLALCLPTRKIWHHALVVFPLLALLGAGGLAPWLRRWLETPLRRRMALGALGAVTLAAAIFSAGGFGRLILPAPCLGRGLDQVASELRVGDSIALVGDKYDWGLIAALAAERRLEPWPVRAISDLPPEVQARTHWAIVPDGQGDPPPEWVLAGRDQRLRAYRRP